MTKIQWTDKTWNPIVGCSVSTPGCTNCYAMKMAARLGTMPNMPRYHSLTKKVNGNAVWTGEVRLVESALMQPLKRKKPTMYFVNSMGDLFHENVPDEWIDQVFAVMALCPQHTFQVLTKRADRMQQYMVAREIAADNSGLAWPLCNVWLGVSVENQNTADERISLLVDAPAAVRFVSAEPLIGRISLVDRDPVKLGRCLHPVPLKRRMSINWLKGWGMEWNLGKYGIQPLNWVIVGGESGPNARPMHPDWARSLRDQCAEAGVPFFFKQEGGPKGGGNLLDGKEYQQMPEAGK